jgi:hypothetical protein
MTGRLGLHIRGRAVFNAEERATPLLKYLLQAGVFAPQYWGGLPPLRKRFTKETLPQAISLLVNRVGQETDLNKSSGEISLERRKRPEVSCRIEWIRGAHTPFSKPFYYIEEEYTEDVGHLEAWLAFCWPLLGFHDAWFAAVCLDREWEDHNVLTYQKRRLPDWPDGYKVQHGVGTELQKGVPGVYWGTYFGPYYVDWFGRERFDTLPCVDKQELPTGGIFFTTAPTPFDWSEPETQAMQRSVMDHLGADAFFDMQALRAKMTAIGEPFTESFDPRQLIPALQVPEFPFAHEMEEQERSREEKIEEARQYFESRGYSLVNIEGDTLLFRDGKGGITKVDIGAASRVEHWPRL